MVKFKLYYNKDMETEFLNEMSRQGYAMTGYFMGFYHFDRCRPGEYIYQIDLTEGMFRLSSNYREFMRDMGVEIVFMWFFWVVLRRRAEEGPFELYTDVESRIAHYTKIRMLFKVCMVIEICCFFTELLCVIQAGFAAARVLVILLLLIILTIGREIVRINGILAELKARGGMDTRAGGGIRGRKHLGFLLAGLLLDGICFMLPEKGGIGQPGSLYDILKGAGHAVALLLMLIGLLICIFWRKRE